MKTVFSSRRSLVTRLVLAFILVAVPPMLLASSIATSMIHATVGVNLERWLHAAANFISTSIDETVDEMDAFHSLLRYRVSQEKVSFSAEELRALAELEANYLLLRGATGEVLFSSGTVKQIDEQPLYPGCPLRWATMEGGARELVIAVQHKFTAEDGSRRVMDIGSGFGIDVAEEKGREPVEMRILLPKDGRFIQVYSSSGEGDYTVPPVAVQVFAEKKAEYYISETAWEDDEPNAPSLLWPVRDDKGEILAVHVISAILLPRDESLPSATVLFWSFFLLGTAFSGGIGYLVARRLVHPIQELTKGVKNIAAGDLSHRVVEKGRDEVGELSAGFNLMARQLEVKQHENMRSARRERSRMLGEIALGFAHEIRNPLVVIKTSAEVVHSTLRGNAKEARLLGFVVEEVGRIDSLISEFLSFAKPAPLALEYFSLHSLVKEIVEISTPEFSRRNIVCSLFNKTGGKHGKGDRVVGERNQIRQVILNLFINAMDAMPEGGRLDLRVFPSEDGEQVCLEVKDTGMGVPEDILPTIYMPFISTKKNGLGLGLAKASAIMDEHGGSIGCESEVGKGTAFILCLNRQ